MKILVIPDIHLKAWMFNRADEIIKSEKPDCVVQLGDLPDDWGQEMNLDLYASFFDRAEKFQDEHPETLWCYGNHDVSYLWDCPESGMASGVVKRYVARRVAQFYARVPEAKVAFIHEVDGILFSHAGICADFARHYGLFDVPMSEVLRQVNQMGAGELWNDLSPIWLRIQEGNSKGFMFRDEEYMQVVGHTPVYEILQEDMLLSTDVFSTTRYGNPIGPQEFIIINSKTRRWFGVK